MHTVHTVTSVSYMYVAGAVNDTVVDCGAEKASIAFTIAMVSGVIMVSL